jgi:hypothetical protein
VRHFFAGRDRRQVESIDGNTHAAKSGGVLER